MDLHLEVELGNEVVVEIEEIVETEATEVETAVVVVEEVMDGEEIECHVDETVIDKEQDLYMFEDIM